MHYINNGVDLEQFDYNKEHFRVEDPDLNDPNVFKVIYTGSIRHVNNLGLLLDAAKCVKDPRVKLLVWGDGDEREALERRVRDENISNVIFKGRVEKKYVPSIVSRADLNFAHNSFTYLFNYGISFNKLFDYFAAGQPILCDFPCRYNPVVTYGAGTEVRDPQPQEVAAVIDQLSELSDEQRQSMGANARRAAEDYDFKRLTDKLTALAGDVPAIRLAADRCTQEIAKAQAADRLAHSERTFCLDGWVPCEDVPKLEALLEKFCCAWELEDPSPEEYPDVPVKLKNNRLTWPLNMVTEMYSLPAYDGVDPNPLMAPFFILFYGIMMADMGYGLLMILASIIITKKARPKGTSGQMFGLMFSCGISTFIMGALTGGFFGDFLPQLAGIINPNTPFKALPSLFTPLDDTITILIGAMALGFVQIVTGMAISFVEKLKKGEIMDAIWEELTWWVVFAGIACMALGVTNIVLYVGIGMVVVGSGWSAKGFGKVTAIFGSVYNHVTGYFGDILSYSRLMTLMLAGSVIASVFNTLGAIPGNVVIFLIVSMLGNGLNFALNLLSCYVHDLRLQCLEYFGKFYKDGGRPFKPLAINTKYVDIQS